MIQNAAARLVFNEPKRAHVTPLFVSLHWLPVAARIKFKTPMIAYRTTTGSAPTYFHSLLRIYIPSRSLRSASERRLVVPSQRGSKSLSRTFSFTIPGWWNDLRTPMGSLSIFKQQLKIHLFQLKIKSLLLSHHHSTSALVSEILMSVLQTVQKNNRQFTYGQTVQKKQQTIYIWTDSAKNCTGAFTVLQTVQKTTTTAIYICTDSAKKQQQFTYGQYIFTDCTEDNVQNTHTYTQYT